MIVHRVTPKASRAGGFKRLGQYVTAPFVPGSGGEPAAGADALGAYIADQARHGDRVAWVRITNCHAPTVRGAIAEMDATQALNTRSKVDPNYHLVVAFPPGEVPKRAQIEDIEDTLVRGLGLSEHQRISALHGDKAHLHLHVAINLIHPETFRAAKIFRDRTTLAELAAGLEVKHRLERTSHEIPNARVGRTPGAARAMEAHTGQEPFVGWVRRVAGPALLEAAGGAESWSALHGVAARYGLELRQRGAGLVIGKVGEPALMMKASALDRSMSYPKLVERLGAFEPVGDATRRIAPETTYERGVPPDRRRDQDLWRRYSAVRGGALRERTSALAAIDARDKRFRAEVSAHYGAKFAEIKRLKVTIGIDPRIRYAALKREQAAVLARHREAMRAARQTVRETHPVPSWADWLRGQAEAGNRAAGDSLRHMAARRERFTDTLIRMPRDAGRTIFRSGIKPKVARNGDAAWRLPDGGALVETETGIRMPTPSRAAAVLALEMARDRGKGAPLVVDGTETQQQALVDAAVQTRIDVRFADPMLEAERVWGLRERDAVEGRVASGQRAEAIGKFIAARNSWPDPADTTWYRRLTEDDAGTATFLAVHRLPEGDIALWRLGSETLVQDLSGESEALAWALLPGQMADLADVVRPGRDVGEAEADPPPSLPAGEEPEPDNDHDIEPDL